MMFPSDNGFYMPAEFMPHTCTFIEWPKRESVWKDDLSIVKRSYADVANKIANTEDVVMLVSPELEKEARAICGQSVKTMCVEHDDSWVRDNGPTFVVNNTGNIAGVAWQFNAWGGKHVPYDKDATVAKQVLKNLNVPIFESNIVLEGGAIDVDGMGTMLVTRECVLNKNRNKNLTENNVEEIFAKYLGIKKTIWLDYGLFGDETDGHVDNVACFAGPNTIVIQGTEDKNDPNYMRFKANMNVLTNATDANGKKLDIVVIEQPPCRMYNNERLTLSYINYYVTNTAILVPVFGVDAKSYDDKACGILKDLFPGRDIVPTDGSQIIKGGGNIHCITQQMPSVAN